MATCTDQSKEAAAKPKLEPSHSTNAEHLPADKLRRLGVGLLTRGGVKAGQMRFAAALLKAADQLQQARDAEKRELDKDTAPTILDKGTALSSKRKSVLDQKYQQHHDPSQNSQASQPAAQESSTSRVDADADIGVAAEGVVQDTNALVTMLLAECSDLLDERDTARAEHAQALRVIDAKNAVIATLEDQISRLKRPRVTVDASLNDESADARKAALLAFKLLALRQAKKIDAYVADAQGRYSKHPDFWIVRQLSPLVDKGDVTRDELLLALQDPAVWYKTDKKLYRAKAKRNTRDSESPPLKQLLEDMGLRKRTRSPRIEARAMHNIGENADPVVSI
mgnify:CR=1 FL=1